ncbi:MotA/TolQ/ExbB proton channel family protein [Parahaliea mediterranea]|uniref:MotA/TolQ/ExbB proton channel family protein n=1 Tax=Parahaliea mediterranea TaxID=651086 RepID=A0A939IKD1_9GAMM|nr:MotA/TolQ/ExbB proton channel family protein [Parahaliea mediterranea]MBN7797206.1 MotA/TolQ/ExbB proton channel family protein [Parahaliea mediterranea]
MNLEPRGYPRRGPRQRGERARGWALGLLLAVSGNHAAGGLDIASAGLAGEIQAARQALSASETRINRERRELSRRLQALETEVGALRDQNAAARRAADERDITLANLETRLGEWREQSAYQHRLIDEYIDRYPGGTLPEQRLDTLRALVDTSARRVIPTWRERQIVLDSGELVPAMTLGIGPVSWYLREDSGASGLLEHRDDGPPRVRIELGDDATDALATLRREGRGHLSLDPTLEYGFATGNGTSSVVDHVSRGGIWVLPILAMGLAALLVSAGKLLHFRRLAPQGAAALPSTLAEDGGDGGGETLEQLRSRLATGDGVTTRLLDITLSTPAGTARDDRLFSEISHYKRALDSWLGTLTVVAAVSPLLGLLGTVSGMIETFQLMTLFGAGDPEAVSSGISKALITTELGLVVAIPALLLHTVLSRWSRQLLALVEDTAITLSRWQERAA